MYLFLRLAWYCLVVLISSQIMADDHYRVIIHNVTKYPIYLKILSKVDGLDYANIKSITVHPGQHLSQDQRIATSTHDSILRIDNDYETCTLKNGGAFPIKIPSSSINHQTPVLTLDVLGLRTKKFACFVEIRN